MKKTVFDASWKQWIRTNIANKCDKDGIFKILLDEGYDYQAIKREMNYEPSVPPFMLANPLKSSQNSEHSPVQATFKASERFLPNAVALDKSSPEAYQVSGFLEPEECEMLQAAILQALAPLTFSQESAVRTKQYFGQCGLSHSNVPVVHDINQRICRYIGIHPSYSESLVGLRLQPGQTLTDLVDYFDDDDEQDQRTMSVVISLTKGTDDGYLSFPTAPLSQHFSQGDALAWNNLTREGTPNPSARYTLSGSSKGPQTFLIKRFTQRSDQIPAPERNLKEINEFIPNYTQRGFVKKQVPAELLDRINSFYSSQKHKVQSEHVPGDFVVAEKQQVPSSLVDLPEEMRTEILQTLHPIVEEWAGVKLIPRFTYGIRIYHRGAILKPHRDRKETHIIGVIINIDQKVDSDWPLEIEDNLYRTHKVILSPGEMVFYEAGRLIHGRPSPFDGERFVNIFCHYSPEGYKHPTL